MTPIESGWDVDLLVLEDPKRYQELLEAYFLTLGGGASDVTDAIARSERGEEPSLSDLDIKDSTTIAAYRGALKDVRAERERRNRGREHQDRVAAGLLTVSRLRNVKTSIPA